MGRAWRWASAILCFAVSVALAAAPNAEGQKGKGAAFEAGLVRCADVKQPTALSRCGTDSLQGGTAEITEEGEVEVTVAKAAANVAYDVVYRSLDGRAERPIGQLRTNSLGNGYLNVEQFFALREVGSGNVVLKRGGFDQFVTGFEVAK